MAKTIVKEIIIMLLLCLAIILILGILLYGYAPMSKTVPIDVAYSTPEEVREELISADEIDESKIIMTYEVDSTDLNNYARVRNYKPGKSNPFSSYETQTSQAGTEGNANSANGASGSNGGSGTSTNNDGTSTDTQSNSNNSSNTNASQGFYPDKGTK